MGERYLYAYKNPTAQSRSPRFPPPDKENLLLRSAAMIEYKILKELLHNPAHTQRSLANKLGISLGKANFVLSGLVEKGIVKLRRLTTKPGAIRWKYILTPRGMKEKVNITRNYLATRQAEFEEIKKEIAELKKDVESQAK
ncbi:MAG: MarR family EPS-associated transcriptional regulator [Chitinivibrionales bacterium]|nr:MarR family EPS-associated transcriptional regulator [Chitinivibrionales bacterium]